MAKKRLDALLTERNLAPSPEKARAEILAGNVLVNDEPAVKAGMTYDESAVIRLREKFPYVSRGALKLIGALDHYRIDVRGLTAVDVGSSTGGFTDVLLERGAAKVYCVDSGTNQLDWKLRSDPRVVVMENTNARELKPEDFDPRPELAVIDVSFVSATRVLQPVANILKRPFQMVLLIKPQFELDKDKIGKKGLVKEIYREEAVGKVVDYSKSIGLMPGEVIESPITGSRSGNVEYLVLLTGPVK